MKPQLKPKPKNIESKVSIDAPITRQKELQNLKTGLRSIPQENPSEKNLKPKEPSQLEEMLAKQRQKIGEL
ncbi:hypothetical protein [Candidatus Regiella insecticola]|uniref:hypothetical protein n=1 Tax=Candidatus Regiella insecticola TaxID=138073 RepID=UPI000587B61C|nr:hypothetical protein [Candidatus Regiella insecticola]